MSTLQQLMNRFEHAQFPKQPSSPVRATIFEAGAMLYVSFSSTINAEVCLRGWESIKWHFYGKRASERYDLEDKKQIVVKIATGEQLLFARTSINSYGCGSNSIENVTQFIQYIHSLFKVSKVFLHIHPSNFHHLEAIQSVDVLRKSARVEIHEGTVTNEEMPRILTGFETDSLTIHCSTERNFACDGTISIGRIQILKGSWFKGPLLLNLDCQNFQYHKGKITEEHLNAFLREWLNNTPGCCRMQSLSVHLKRPQFSQLYDDSPPRK